MIFLECKSVSRSSTINMFYILLLFSIISLLFLLYFYMHNTEHGKLIGKIPGNEGYPIIGCILNNLQNPEALFYRDRNLANKYRKIYKSRHAHVSIVVINNPEDIETLLSNSKFIYKSKQYAVFKPWLGDGLVLSSGEKWQTRRKLLTNAFHFSILKDACKTFDEHGKILVEEVKKVEGKEFEVHGTIAKFTLFSICQSAMGISLKNKAKEIDEYRKAAVDIAQCIMYKFARLIFETNFIIELTPMAKFERKVVDILHKFTNEVIKERRNNNDKIIEEINKNNSDNSDTEYMSKSGKQRLAMLDLLLNLEKEGKIDQIGIREEVNTFTFGGHDTTTSALKFFLLNLANHKNIQDCLVEELKSKINSRDDEITLELINQLPYLDRCFKESLRLYPPVHFFSRHINENLKLKNYTIPKDTIIGIFPFDLHRDYTLYPNPFKYDPERFTPENCAKRHNFAYIPFSAGPRNCIGQKYASFEVKSLIITILRNFVIHPVTTPEQLRFTTDFVLTTKEPIKIKFQQREDTF